MLNNESAFTPNDYDKKIRNTIPYYDDIYEQMADIVKSLGIKSFSWLDAGCGTGTLIEKVCGEHEQCKFTLCDPSISMLKIAEEKLKKYSNHKFRFLECSSQQLMFVDEFDVLTAVQVHHYLKNSERIEAIRRCYQSLKPEGIFFSLENTAPMSKTGKQIALSRWKSYQIKKGSNTVDAQKHIERYGVNYFPITLNEQIDILKQCGFRIIEIFWASYIQVGIFAIK